MHAAATNVCCSGQLASAEQSLCSYKGQLSGVKGDGCMRWQGCAHSAALRLQRRSCCTFQRCGCCCLCLSCSSCGDCTHPATGGGQGLQQGKQKKSWSVINAGVVSRRRGRRHGQPPHLNATVHDSAHNTCLEIERHPVGTALRMLPLPQTCRRTHRTTQWREPLGRLPEREAGPQGREV